VVLKINKRELTFAALVVFPVFVLLSYGQNFAT